ncbi:hypothetical protein NKI30_18545 [Mesorhizobium opportunistum]|uniref:hypothetical protein n=1 Tax=Mesorhizobium opportunistum TaxID=593909 RepID=UPI00333CDA1C
MLALLVLLARVLAWLVVVGGGCLARGRLLGLLLFALFPAWLLLVGGGSGLAGRCLLGLLLLVVGFYAARLLILCGGSGLAGCLLLGLLLLVALFPARLLFVRGGSSLAGGCLFSLLLLALLALRLLFPLLCAGFGRFALGASRLGQNQRCGAALHGAERGTSLKRGCAQRRGCHQQAKCCACQNPWLAFHRNFSLWGPIPAQTFIIHIGSGLWALPATKDD